MTVNKLERFAQIANYSHVLEYTEYQKKGAEKPAGRWNEEVFGNDKPITLELGCGTGAYTLELARRNPDCNYIGIDIKGARLWKGAKKAKAEELQNVRFLRIFIDHLDEYFAQDEVSEIWITFSDPYPRAGDRNKRLTAPKFLSQYKNVLEPRHPVHFKTDHSSFFEYTCRSVEKADANIIDRVDDIYTRRSEDPLLTIKTDYEKKHLQQGKIISYLKFIFKN